MLLTHPGIFYIKQCLQKNITNFKPARSTQMNSKGNVYIKGLYIEHVVYYIKGLYIEHVYYIKGLYIEHVYYIKGLYIEHVYYIKGLYIEHVVYYIKGLYIEHIVYYIKGLYIERDVTGNMLTDSIQPTDVQDSSNIRP